ncbi:hypothetical protein E2C01_066440 [Portunus trituberculatus]|uniref:Uncharacterized protein n=1 Tax=Portunus trituberculatus TaxID=210409 RepID=A0A5B7HQH6_PORTR|nr:hypothetical protein [Portunus trituberculatus]
MKFSGCQLCLSADDSVNPSRANPGNNEINQTVKSFSHEMVQQRHDSPQPRTAPPPSPPPLPPPPRPDHPGSQHSYSTEVTLRLGKQITVDPLNSKHNYKN